MQPEEFERTPPQDLAAEQSVLGGMLMSAAAVDDVSEILRTGDFYRPCHGIIFDAIADMRAAGDPVDAVTVNSRLVENGLIGKLPHPAYLHDLLEAVPTAASAGYYARIVKDQATLREVIEFGTRAVQAGYGANGARTATEIVNLVQSHAMTLTSSRTGPKMATFTDLLDPVLAEILSDERPGRGLSTGLGVLDDIIGGLKNGQLIVVAGRPGMGKTVLATDFLRATSLHRAEPSIMFSLEMTAFDLEKRLLAAEAEANLRRVINGGLRSDEKARLVNAGERLRGAFLTIDDTAEVDLAGIRSRARSVAAETGLALVVVDYLQLMNTGGTGANRATELGQVSRGLKVLARELEVPVVACAQLNRSSESRQDRRPQLSDLRESGSIEADADVVILLHRPDYAEPEHPRAGEVDLIVAKNRNGPIETVSAIAQLHWARFVDPGI